MSKHAFGRYAILYMTALTIPAFLGINVYQSHRYAELKAEVSRLEEAQSTRVEDNKRLIADIAALSSSERVERLARTELELRKIQPEAVLQIKIEGGPGHGL